MGGAISAHKSPVLFGSSGYLVISEAYIKPGKGFSPSSKNKMYPLHALSHKPRRACCFKDFVATNPVFAVLDRFFLGNIDDSSCTGFPVMFNFGKG